MKTNEISLRRLLAIFAGSIFLLSGIGKLTNIVAFQKLLIDYGLGVVNLMAPFVVLIEILFGTMLVLQLYTKEVSLLSICMLVMFTIVFTYAWRTHGVTDCGCFGNVTFVPHTPISTYLRNFILILMLIYVCVNSEYSIGLSSWKLITIATTMFAATFLSGMSYRPKAFIVQQHPYEKKWIGDTPLANYTSIGIHKSELLLFFSYKCPHCINSLENFKLWRTIGMVDELMAYAIVDTTISETDSVRSLVLNYYSDLPLREIGGSRIKGIDMYPTAFYISNDTIQNVFQGALSSPILYMNLCGGE